LKAEFGLFGLGDMGIGKANEFTLFLLGGGSTDFALLAVRGNAFGKIYICFCPLKKSVLRLLD
jgi:hypothetical protein